MIVFTADQLMLLCLLSVLLGLSLHHTFWPPPQDPPTRYRYFL